MGRLDRRTANEEDDWSAQQYAAQQEVSREYQLREAEAEAARTAAQENLEAEVYELLNEFMELMEARDYPELETVTLPMTRWWWPLPIATRKAVWTLYAHDGEKIVEESAWGSGTETSMSEYTWYEHVYLLSDGTLIYRLKPGFGIGHSQEKAIFEEWSGQEAKTLKDTLEACISYLRTGRSDRYRDSWPPAYQKRFGIRR